MGLFGGLFDFNHDGKLSNIEKAEEFRVFTSMMDAMDEKEKKDELELNGIDADDLEDMDEEERREVLEDAGLDPDEYL